jgi:phosphate transport system ATP-binding protein
LTAAALPEPVLRTAALSVTAGNRRLLESVTLEIPAGGVHGLIGPSGAGKTTLLKSMNRLAELTPSLRIDGQVFFQGRPLYRSGLNADDLRADVGILFQQPVVFPQSILANVLFGVRHLGRTARREWPAVAESALREAALWDEVKDRLNQPARRLSVGQQQRLCLARTLATQPIVILMDEPTSALDPRSTETIEDLIRHLGKRRTVVLVTHHPAQARRVCDRLAFLGVRDGAGRVLCAGPTAEVLAATDIPEIRDYGSTRL